MTEKFFETLQKHSNTKIEILNRYYKAWIRKITKGKFNSNRCLVIDGFAGEGIYDDGAEGSPIKLIEGAIEYYLQSEKNSWELPKITILLIEGKKKVYEKLKNNIFSRYDCTDKKDGSFQLDNYPTIDLIIINDSFEKVMNKILDEVNNRLIPSFCFVDPFGFSCTPFDIFKRYLENDKAEILFNFMYEEINRFILAENDSSLIHSYENLFGVDNLDELKESIKDKSAPIRKETIINYYSKQLLEKTFAKYVLNFEFRKNGRAKMFLIHATKNIHGLALMKDVMWKVDETGAFLYDDRKNDDQIQFEFINEITKEENIEKLSNLIIEEFKNQKYVSLKTIETFVLEKTIYPIVNYFRPAMNKLEKNNLIKVERIEGAKKGFNEKVKYIDF